MADESIAEEFDENGEFLHLFQLKLKMFTFSLNKTEKMFNHFDQSKKILHSFQQK